MAVVTDFKSSYIIPLLVLLYCRTNNPPTVQRPLLISEFDYIIVGGGSAGDVLAGRLTENNPLATILLLEAGGDDDKVENEIPAAYSSLFRSDEDWKYLSTPQENSCLSLINKQCTIPRGKVIGGSSSINSMIYMRGNKHDYDSWRDLGNPGWSYEDNLPYFIKAEGYTGKLTDERKKYHGTKGPLTVTPLIWKSNLTDVFLQAVKEQGYTLGDYNAANQLAFKEMDYMIRKGARCSNAKAYLKPNMATSVGLFISLNSRVKKIHVDKNTMTATGVTFIRDGKERTVKAKREVILSAGAIGSPQILMLSGIGPKKHLEEKKIEIVLDLPGVGRNYQEHMAGMVVLTTGKDLTQEEIDELNSDQAMLQWIQGTGPLTTPGGLEGNGFLKTKYLPENATYPDIQVYFQSTPWTTEAVDVIKNAYFYNDEFINGYLNMMLNKETVSLYALLIRSKSRGWVELNTTDIMDPPIIEPNYFTHEDDIKTLVEGNKKVYEIANSPVFRDLGYKPFTRKIPGCEDLEFASDEYWECSIRHLSLVMHHSSATCKMGPKTDQMAVVDNRLRLYGIKKLRVADASIMPLLTSGNTNCPVTMIAEKVADMIIEDNRHFI